MIFFDIGALRCSQHFFFSGMWSKKNDEKNQSNGSSDSSSSTSSKKSSTFSSFSNQFSFPNLDAKKISMVQEMLAKQPPEKQRELMEQALKFQQSFSKIPGFKKFAERQSKLVENIMAAQSPPNTSCGSSTSQPYNADEKVSSGAFKAFGSNSSTGAGTNSITRNPSIAKGRGPTLDELKKVHLGDEIEELFAELRLIREKKNEYREKFHIASIQLRELQEEKQKIEQTERQVREKLKKSEQEVLILNTETMELEDKVKKGNALLKKHEQWKRDYEALKAKSEEEQVKQSSWFKELERQLQQKEDALQSLQRKLYRLRRHDPLLQFSIACSEFQRLSTAVMACARSPAARACSSLSSSSSSPSLRNSGDTVNPFFSSDVSTSSSFSSQGVSSPSVISLVKEKQDEAFELLQDNFHVQQRAAWLQACRKENAAPRVLVQAAHGLLLSILPFSNYDCSITIISNPEEEKEKRQSRTGSSLAANGPRRMRVEEVVKLFKDYGYVVDVINKTPLNNSSTISISSFPDHNNDRDNRAGDVGAENLHHSLPQTYQLLVRKPSAEEQESSPHSASFIRSLSGPYAVALAAYFCSPPLPISLSEKEVAGENKTRKVPHSSPSPSSSPVLVLDKVVPHLSLSMLRDSHRTKIHYETARASGPGGQAVNVAETQIHAKVTVDGEVAFTASAQDSRSALQNRKNVEEQIFNRKRDQFNDQTLNALHPELVRTQLLEKLKTEWRNHSNGRDRSSAVTSRSNLYSHLDESTSSIAWTAAAMREETLSLLKESCMTPEKESQDESYSGRSRVSDSTTFPLDYSVALWAHQLTANNLSASTTFKGREDN